MINTPRGREIIEQALREKPLCVCGAPTVVAARADGVWLACASLNEPALRRLLGLQLAFGHTNNRLVDRSRLLAVA
jgi:hypothetical protein